jgi:two-component sensor histidine kinase
MTEADVTGTPTQGGPASLYQQIFGAMSEGFALVEAIRDESGQLADYVILEINPALQRILGVGPDVVGRRLSQGGQPDARWLKACATVLRTGEPLHWDFHNPATDLWHEIRLNPAGGDRIAQFFFDITERERAKARQAQLFDELNHRVKNNLALVSGLLSLQARNAGEGEARTLLMDAVRRVQSIADLHASLYKGPHNDRVSFDAYLRDLCESLAKSMLDPERVEIVLDAEPAELDLDRATPLGMALNELITNAAKYAYPPPQTGQVRVRLTLRGDTLQLSVEDDGKGLSEGARPQGSGIGMKLVSALVQQAGATLDVASGGAGACFVVTVPVAR